MVVKRHLVEQDGPWRLDCRAPTRYAPRGTPPHYVITRRGQIRDILYDEPTARARFAALARNAGNYADGDE